MDRITPGLGELLRYLTDLVDQGAAQAYAASGLDYKARYTPVMRAISHGASTVTEIVAATHVTQGAISQTVALMVGDGLVQRSVVADGRKSAITLTPAGKQLLRKLEPHWARTFHAIDALETEIGWPLRKVLVDATRALEANGFGERVLANVGPKRRKTP